jgi:predicted ABC-type ATPase
VPRKLKPRVVVIAGPNGAGKTTYAESILKALGINEFVNADRIAQGLSGLNTESVSIQAGRIMLKRLDELAAASADFGFESTLASVTPVNFLRRLKASGYRVLIFYFTLASPRLAFRRVQHRVKLGGHLIKKDVVLRRFGRSAANMLRLYIPLADEWIIQDNTARSRPTVVASGTANAMTVLSESKWQRLNHHAQRS